MNDLDLRARLHPTLTRLLAEGRPVAPAQVRRLAAELDLPPEGLADFLRWRAEVDAQGNIVGVFGLSLVGSPHRFELGGRALFTRAGQNRASNTPRRGRR